MAASGWIVAQTIIESQKHKSKIQVAQLKA